MDAAGEIVAALRAAASARNVAGRARSGIRGAKSHGVPVARLRQLARPHGRDATRARPRA